MSPLGFGDGEGVGDGDGDGLGAGDGLRRWVDGLCALVVRGFLIPAPV